MKYVMYLRKRQFCISCLVISSSNPGMSKAFYKRFVGRPRIALQVQTAECGNINNASPPNISSQAYCLESELSTWGRREDA